MERVGGALFRKALQDQFTKGLVSKIMDETASTDVSLLLSNDPLAKQRALPRLCARERNQKIEDGRREGRLSLQGRRDVAAKKYSRFARLSTEGRRLARSRGTARVITSSRV
jgi:hypothetical protein